MPTDGPSPSDLPESLRGLFERHPEFQTVLDILGACVLADRLERDSELVELTTGAQRITRGLDPTTVVARRDMLDWFAAARPRLQGLARDADARAALFARLTSPTLRIQTLVAVFGISVCDYHLDDEESAFFQQAAEVWGTTPPDADILDVLG